MSNQPHILTFGFPHPLPSSNSSTSSWLLFMIRVSIQLVAKRSYVSPFSTVMTYPIMRSTMVSGSTRTIGKCLGTFPNFNHWISSSRAEQSVGLDFRRAKNPNPTRPTVEKLRPKTDQISLRLRRFRFNRIVG
jgi:hypothetical protein